MILTRPAELPALTGLRGLAALCIVAAHFSVATKVPILAQALNLGPVGMPLFFTLSGFIMHYIYADQLCVNYKKEVQAFALARFARIYPLFVLLLGFYGAGSFGMALLRNPEILVSYATLTGSWWYWTLEGKPLIDTRYGISWSVSTEAFFYVAYAAFIYRLAAIKSAKMCATLLVLLCVGSYAALYGIYSILTAANVDLAQPFYRWLFYVSPYFHLPEFIGGCLACQLVRMGANYLTPVVSRTLGWLGLVWIAGAMILLQIAWVAQHQIFFLHYVNFLHWTFLVAPGCLMLIISVATTQNFLSFALSSRPMIFAGEISYSIYLGHMLVRAVVIALLGSSIFALGVVAPVLLIVSAVLLYQMVEKPSRSWLRRSRLRRA